MQEKKLKQQHEKIELLIYRIYCWKRKQELFWNEQKKRVDNPKKEFINIR